MAYLEGSAATVFKERAKASPEGSQEEVLFSGLAKLAYDIHDLQGRVDKLRREVSELS